VNPQPAKGVVVVARIAEVLARRRPDIPLLVVESRGRASWLEQIPIDLSGAENLHTMKNTWDPRDFYRVTRVMLVPSLTGETFGLVAAEAMMNGIPVVASNRGALPETIANAGLTLAIPARALDSLGNVPTEADVEPWIAAIVHLWDDQRYYESQSRAATVRSAQWQPARMAPIAAEFFYRVTCQSTANA
jgi:glycosyltransferase involved in cell wall biosynthesis